MNPTLSLKKTEWRNDGIIFPLGFKAAGIACGIKKNHKKDLALIVSEKPCVAAGVFTLNDFCAAPVILCKKNLKNRKAQVIVANSGNANACTGDDGDLIAEKTASYAANLLGISNEDVLVCSTGSIGKMLPLELIEQGLIQCREQLSSNNNQDPAEAILTTDRFVKQIAVQVNYDQNKNFKIGCMCKGAGMIEPNMATMLCFITSDCQISEEMAQNALKTAVDQSFNKITVDGDMSTNDSVIFLANGLAQNPSIQSAEDPLFQLFQDALTAICQKMAQLIILDGEGATKIIEINVQGTESKEQATKIAKRIAHSPLIKCAMYGEIPNWGRIMAALGSLRIGLNQNQVQIAFNNQIIFDQGKMNTTINDFKMNQEFIKIDVTLQLGDFHDWYWFSDLSETYVEINKV